MEDAACYMCDRPATSREHVPPRCLFPEMKDIGENHRVNLLTVPSCDEHNSGKSADDEFLMASLAGMTGNNRVGILHKFSKVNRAIFRSSFGLLDQALSDQTIEWLEVSPGTFLDVTWGKPDYARLARCFERIAHGMHLCHFGQRFRGTLKYLFDFPTKDGHWSESDDVGRRKFVEEFDGKPRLGSNPEVFTYQFSIPDQLGVASAHFQFYGSMNIYVAFYPGQIQRLIELMNEARGVAKPVYAWLGGKLYALNSAAVEDDGASLRDL
ncbi:hypothetical protein [Planctomyces sp. SH-PL14]|uniref:hypothetical protein n=1 Tax=Planctomyces sp. SH-PL14 TaxID=1632864 RepID=UPI00078BEDB0|nr:hypothetical protein [Planctomyces sp. SH-PL14]AMV22322.1 hypothetical protein VT03_30760 [Planctomyces sp. SH-PL14]